MTNSTDLWLKCTGQEIWELEVTSSTAGDTPLDVPVDTTKRHRIYGIFRPATQELLELIGTSIQGDAVLYTKERLTLTSQIEYSGTGAPEDATIYEIEKEVEHNYYLAGRGYSYVLRKKGKRIGAV